MVSMPEDGRGTAAVGDLWLETTPVAADIDNVDVRRDDAVVEHGALARPVCPGSILLKPSTATVLPGMAELQIVSKGRICRCRGERG
jgi:hypothetical protein